MDDLIFETEFWKIVMNKDQYYLGRAVVVLQRPCPNLSSLTVEEMQKFLGIVKWYESAVKKSFGATMFNWACLMNFAYRNNPPDPQVHWHVRPRYDHVVDFAGKSWSDQAFSDHYVRGKKYTRILDDQTFQAIRDELRKHVI